jgi:hypothetical protein
LSQINKYMIEIEENKWRIQSTDWISLNPQMFYFQIVESVGTFTTLYMKAAI